jgi:hypothetical protein
MVNSLDAYRHAGNMAGKARVRGDAGLANHWRKWYGTALRLEPLSDRVACALAYEEAYRAAATPAQERFA